MALAGARYTVNDVAVAVHAVDESAGARLLIRNIGTGNRDADLGAAGVAFGAGFALDAATTVEVEVKAGEVLYAISDAEGTTITVLRT